MAEEKKVEKVETVPKEDFDKLANEHRRVVLAYNKLLAIVANEYAEKLTKSIFDEVDSAAATK